MELIPGDTKGESRLRTYTECELNLMFTTIKDERFHDLRRTFGLNLIKQGMSIYKVSKLLGHKSVSTTDKHYAPLLTVEIENFTLWGV